MADGIGRSPRRKEDLRLLRGQGNYSDDLTLPGQAYAVMVRSPHAHARLVAIDIAPALAIPGVIGVLTGADVLADGLRPVPHTQLSAHPAEMAMRNDSWERNFVSPHYPLPADRARFVGEAVAMVVASSVAAAKDAAEAVAVTYDVLPAVTDGLAAAAEDAPILWEQSSSNVCLDAVAGDAAATEAGFARAAHVTRIETWVQRVNGVPMEPRAATGTYDAATSRYTLQAGSGVTMRQRADLAHVLGVAPEMVRTMMRDVGGNFGTRGGFSTEFALVVWAARRFGRPIKWTCERQEAFLCDYQARDLRVEAELALDAEGNFLAIRGSNLANIGAHTVSFASLQKGVEIMSGLYHIPASHFRGRAVITNTPPTRPYRSAGRPEAIFVIERLIDLAAREAGFDRIELRRRNLVPPAMMPYCNPFNLVYDNGDYRAALDWSLELADWDNFPARKAEARARGRLRGIGVGTYVDTATGVTREWTEMTVKPEGEIEMVIGTVSTGQGHETSFAQLVEEWLGVPMDKVRLVTGDTDLLVAGGGSHSGRSMRLAAIIVRKASDDIIAKGLRIAAHVLEASEVDIEFAGGRFVLKGTDRSVGLFEVAAAAVERRDMPADLSGPLSAACDETTPAASFPYGSHVCEVEIDPETGTIAIETYAAIDDVGRAINPMIVDGQTHGGAVQGIGQALLEQCVYEAGSGQLLSGSFMDYAMPRAKDMPSFLTGISEVPSSTHPLGVRAGGEGGTTPALAVVVNAIVDALSDEGVRHIDMPATPLRVWQAIRDGRMRLARGR